MDESIAHGFPLPAPDCGLCEEARSTVMRLQHAIRWQPCPDPSMPSPHRSRTDPAPIPHRSQHGSHTDPTTIPARIPHRSHTDPTPIPHRSPADPAPIPHRSQHRCPSCAAIPLDSRPHPNTGCPPHPNTGCPPRPAPPHSHRRATPTSSSPHMSCGPIGPQSWQRSSRRGVNGLRTVAPIRRCTPWRRRRVHSARFGGSSAPGSRALRSRRMGSRRMVSRLSPRLWIATLSGDRTQRVGASPVIRPQS